MPVVVFRKKEHHSYSDLSDAAAFNIYFGLMQQ